jgi:cobalamin biosynthesis Mg chelatase CobN
MALEELKQKENELKQMMIYLGRPGLHSDYVRFCVEARKRRQEAAKEKERNRAAFMEGLQNWVVGIIVFALLAGVLVGGLWLLRYKGVI